MRSDQLSFLTSHFTLSSHFLYPVWRLMLGRLRAKNRKNEDLQKMALLRLSKIASKGHRRRRLHIQTTNPHFRS